MKKIDQPGIGDILGKLPKEEKLKAEKVEVPPMPVLDVDVGLLDKLRLWASSWFRNEALQEYEGEHSQLPNIFSLISSPVTMIVIVVVVLILGYFLLR